MSGNLYIICAPSGAGKTSMVKALLASDPAIKLSISYTTRAPRPGEVDGQDYHYITREEFTDMVARSEFLESAEVHGNLYGTSQSWINNERIQGNDILLEIDWQGAAQVRRLISDSVGIFVLPPSMDALRTRLRNRGLDKPEIIAQRLEAAREEISHVGEFDYVIINKDFDEAVRDLISIVRAERLKSNIQLSRHADLIEQLTK